MRPGGAGRDDDDHERSRARLLDGGEPRRVWPRAHRPHAPRAAGGSAGADRRRQRDGARRRRSRAVTVTLVPRTRVRLAALAVALAFAVHAQPSPPPLVAYLPTFRVLVGTS